ncbi:hypothetical protein [Sutcliffiella halmapala]|uniref:hypothetical protein n=1 Tax=Sutcliffiella halmapala TaxID=79882 RepID=UPI000994A072|nr:hypothetical protein [Sutcliffiella halmapala]
MKKSIYKSAISQLKTSEDFKEKTIQRINLELAEGQQKTKHKGDSIIMKSIKKPLVSYTVALSALAIISIGGVGLYSTFQQESAPEKMEVNDPGITAKQQVNIDGIITEVSEDGKSFKVGELWVTVTEDTVFGITGPTAPDPEDQLLEKEFKVGNAVSGYTNQDITSGNVIANNIYNNFSVEEE